jgi:hypothetical protein
MSGVRYAWYISVSWLLLMSSGILNENEKFHDGGK